MTKTISRKTKGTIAAVAGGALLLGTGATFAVWNADATLTGATINTGALDIAGTGFDWEVSGVREGQLSNSGGNLTLGGSAFYMLPGDTVTGTATITPTATGLTATLDASGGGTTSNLPTDATIRWTLNGTEIGTGGSVDLPTAVETAGAVSQELGVAISLPSDTPRISESRSWTLEALTVTLTQDS